MVQMFLTNKQLHKRCLCKQLFVYNFDQNEFSTRASSLYTISQTGYV